MPSFKSHHFSLYRCLSLSSRQRFASRNNRVFSSVSAAEVHKFSTMDRDWWDATKNPLIHMNALRVNYIQQQATVKDATALDIGCGGGLLSESLSRLGAKVTGIDPSEKLIAAAEEHAQLDERTQQITYIGGTTVEQHLAQVSPLRYDIVCLLEVIEHATDPQSLLSAAATLVRPGGYLFVSTINKTVQSYILTILGAEYVMGYLPIGTHDWTKYVTPDQVRAWAEQHDLQEVNVSGMVLSSSPHSLLCSGRWDWRLDPSNTTVNWIATYQRKIH